MYTSSLEPAFLAKLNITSFHRTETAGGQKVVFFPVIEGVKVVLKSFRGGLDERAIRELEIYKQFSALDGIPHILSTGTFNGNDYVIEEFVDGDVLTDIVNKYAGNYPLIKAMIGEIIKIMQPIWEENFVHRDIKPPNVIIRPSGRPVVIDFGIARDLSAESITNTGVQPLSLKWASPEQIRGAKDQVSYRTDFFSLGILAYFLFHQKFPFGETLESIRNRFDIGEERLEMAESCPIYPFCNAALRFDVASRPRTAEKLLNYLV